MKRAPTNDKNVVREVRNYIGLRDRTKDDVYIAEDRKGCFTVYNSVEGKYVQVWKIAKVYESSKWELSSWLRNLSNSLCVIRNTTPTLAPTSSLSSEIQFLQCVTSCIEDKLQTGHSFLVMRSYRQNTQIWPKDHWCVKPRRWGDHLFDKTVRFAVLEDFQ